MRERVGVNLCHEAGCPDLCCSNVWFAPMSPGFFSDNFPDAQLVKNYEECSKYREGIFYWYIDDEDVIAHIKGLCPWSDSGCSRQERPTICKTFQLGGNKCNKERVRAGLPEIDSSGQEVSPEGGIVKVLLRR